MPGKKKGKNYYAVARGRVAPFIGSWSMASQSVNGFSHAVHQGFTYLHEAQKYLQTKGFSDVLVFDVIGSSKDGWAPSSQDPGYYAVAKGRKRGIYPTYPGAEDQAKGYSGSCYKKVRTRQQAQLFIDLYDMMQKTVSGRSDLEDAISSMSGHMQRLSLDSSSSECSELLVPEPASTLLT